MKNVLSTLKIAVLVIGLIAVSACKSVDDKNKSSTMLVIDSITGTTIAGASAAYLESDVSTTTDDAAIVTLHAALRSTSSSTTSTQYNDVQLTSYSIEYTLPDGTGTAGTDVPNPVEGTMSSLLVKIGDSAAVTLVAVPAGAKLVAPLVGLVGTSTKLQVIAKITMKGQDLAGNSVQTTGQLTVIFGDY